MQFASSLQSGGVVDEGARNRSASSASPSHVVESPDLARRYRRIGRFTFGVPFLGALAAVGLVTVVTPSAPILIMTGVLYVLSVMGLEVGYHRHLSHNAFKAVSPLRAALLVFGAWGWSGPPIYWASTHRLHHGSSDRSGDPHSPHLFGSTWSGFLKGFWHAQVGWMLNTEVVTNTASLGRDLLRDPLVVRLNRHYWKLAMSGLLLPAVLGFAFEASLRGALAGLLWAGFVRIFLVQLLYTGALNSVCHTFGRREFRSGDLSVNNAWFALPTLGQSWHNNHHAFPSAAALNFRWYQLDLGGLMIRLWAVCGLASQLKLPSASALRGKRLSQNGANRDVVSRY